MSSGHLQTGREFNQKKRGQHLETGMKSMDHRIICCGLRLWHNPLGPNCVHQKDAIFLPVMSTDTGTDLILKLLDQCLCLCQTVMH